MKLPKRFGHLVTSQIGDELLVFNPATSRVHCLPASTARVYELCDGETDWQTAAAAVGEEGLARAMEGLTGQALVESTEAPNSRRGFLKTAAAGAVIASLGLPKPAAAASMCVNEGAVGCGAACTTPGFPPSGCNFCCNATCSGNLCTDPCSGGGGCTGNCYCLTFVRCAGANCGAGSTAGDPASPVGDQNFCDAVDIGTSTFCRICVNGASPFNGESNCQRDCQRARGAAFCGGVDPRFDYSCCENF